MASLCAAPSFFRGVLPVALILAAGGWQARAQAKKLADLDPAFQLFLYAQSDILGTCIYRPQERDIIQGALEGLAHELGPAFGKYFPKDAGETAQANWDAYVTTLNALSGSPDCKLTLKELVEKSLRAYCKSLDRYSTYDDAATWRRIEGLNKSDYVGIGVTLQAINGEFACSPFPGGAADRAGIDVGDRLLAIDGTPVPHLSQLEVAALAAGEPGAPVKLLVRHRDGVEETVTVKREAIKASPISVEQMEDGVRVALRRFTTRTVEDMRALIRTLAPGRAVTLDLRGCEGGDLQAAVDTASMFLPSDTVIGKLETLQGRETYVSNNTAPYRPSKLTILQDEFTASGAEMVAVALLSYPPLHAESRGTRSYGKGVTIRLLQVPAVEVGGKKVIEPGVLSITDSRIYGPNDEFWDGEGLSPMIEEAAESR